MRTDTPQTIYLQDYTPAAYLIDRVDLKFDLTDAGTTVEARMVVSRNPAGTGGAFCLVGDSLELVSIKIDGEALDMSSYFSSPDEIRVFEVPESFFLDIVTRIYPQQNTALSGLYVSNDNYFTQCEAEGFRRIMYYLDRPDVMARFSTTLIADKQKYPVLLSNGNPVGHGDLARGRHWVKWVDPFRKPAYLFALVAGKLVKLEDTFITRSGREVLLQIWVRPGDLDKCDHAMQSLKRAMQWDETRFGLEYDLDIYMIVAVGDFNMGAMENKGLNIFNTKFVLAKPDTATDIDFANIEAVIGHEYFHNWTGNRVTCRDWFQLSLKEGLTVFRDQEFSMDLGSRAVERIDQVKTLRTHQFAEDAGPMAHPVRPQSYMEINNFYTVTIYEKGAEVIRMQHTLLGEAGFQKGMALYFRRHDGQAVTTDDFLAAMMDANQVDLTQFKRWYEQAGTPRLHVREQYDAAAQTYTLLFQQSCPSTPGQAEKLPFHIPVKLSLLGADGTALPLQQQGEAAPMGDERVISILAAEQSVTFIGISEHPVPSLLRGFSAPVILHYAYSDDQLAFLLGHDQDAFNRWDAGQQLAERLLLKLAADAAAGRPLAVPPLFIDACCKVLNDSQLDPALAALALTLPAETWLAEQMDIADPVAIHTAREFVQRELAKALMDDWRHHYDTLGQTHYTWTGTATSKRALRNVCLAYLTSTGVETALARAWQQYQDADNMTDQFAALAVLARHDTPKRAAALADFATRFAHDPLVMDKWFSLQAISPLPGTVTHLETLLDHPAFSITNPNKVYALIRSFAAGNPLHFHAADGSGYAWIGGLIRTLNTINPQVAARVVSAFNRWKKYDPTRQALMRRELETLAANPELSSDVFEIVNKALAA